MRRRIWWVVPVLVAAACDAPTSAPAHVRAAAASFVAVSGNLLVNPGFEAGASPWFSIGMSGRTIVSAPVRAGTAALQIQANGTWNRSVSQEVAVTPDSTVAISAWLSSQGLTRGRIALEWRSGRSNAEWSPSFFLKADTLSLVVQGTTGWRVATDTVRVPAGAVAVRVQVVAGRGAGTLWADDVDVSMVSDEAPPPPPPPPPANLLANPGFESGAAQWFSIGMSGRTVVAAPVHGGTKAVQIQANGTWNRSVSQEVAVTPGAHLAATVWWSSQGLTRGRVALEWRSAPSAAEWSPTLSLGADTLPPVLQGSTAWVDVTGGITVPNGASAVRVHLVAGRGAGTMWVDDVTVGLTAPPPPSRPHRQVLLVLLDDMRADQLPYLPLTMAFLAPQSVRFTNAYTPEPDCCPARASLLTGRYSHHTGVWRSYGSSGGAPAFNPYGTIATALQEVGWRTGLWGKYLNMYYNVGPAVPPGWTEWQAMMVDSDQYWTYPLSQNGVTTNFSGVYSPTYLADRAVSWIATQPASQPLFIYYVPFSPHTGMNPVIAKAAPQDVGRYANDAPVVAPSFNVVDAGKPAWLKARLPVDSAHQQAIRRSQQETLESVDREIMRLIGAMEAAGRLDSTLIILASDNSLMHGEHRIEHKFVPYEEAVHIPLVIRYPGAPPRTSNELVTLLDLAPTIAAWTGATLAPPQNGADLTPILLSPVAPWRTDVLLEMLAVNVDDSPPWLALRSGTWKYVEWATGERELYDLATDRYEMVNRAAEPAQAALMSQLSVRLAWLRSQ